MLFELDFALENLADSSVEHGEDRLKQTLGLPGLECDKRGHLCDHFCQFVEEVDNYAALGVSASSAHYLAHCILHEPDPNSLMVTLQVDHCQTGQGRRGEVSQIVLVEDESQVLGTGLNMTAPR